MVAQLPGRGPTSSFCPADPELRLRGRKPQLRTIACSVVGLLVATLTGAIAPEAQARGTPKPNVVVILTDDQRWDSMDQMPQLDAAPEWAHFSNAYVDEPQCCPSRASILPARYPQHTR